MVEFLFSLVRELNKDYHGYKFKDKLDSWTKGTLECISQLNNNKDHQIKANLCNNLHGFPKYLYYQIFLWEFHQLISHEFLNSREEGECQFLCKEVLCKHNRNRIKMMKKKIDHGNDGNYSVILI